ncbi:hypothetical protein PCA20602_02869 [Pandoraea capi]|uniref:Endonuclease GajA/Old nuclease/RecF-like AAA domain-containing protein n=1 Tax=Pandoraea capi TaxID=2508286 RepID=A0ABY6W476_9BURK|nr:AAA family ATPase [Pandoraea capi]VVE15639.1 hypothetical protein PCA20602_02869 [Pandoraea capi]
MFKISTIDISGFWGKFRVESDFNDNVNIIIGKNGTGKTTFMNILDAVLSVDPDGLYQNEFSEVKIKLNDGGKTKTIRAVKYESETTPFPVVDYYISNQKFNLPIVNMDEIRSYPLSFRRRSLEESAKIREILSGLVRLASLSVYRYRLDPDADRREAGRQSASVLSPVDSRLQELRQRLTQYQFELSISAQKISSDLQKDVLISLLYNQERKDGNTYNINFTEDVERQNLIAAYRHLGLSGNDITGRIQKHISAVGKTIKDIKDGVNNIDFAPLDARVRTGHVIELSLEAEKQTKAVYSQVTQFLEILKTFIPDKTFSFQGAELTASGSGPIPLPKLSSGEKQLLILFIEALLQRQQPYIFLADEPELSLHISWQRQVISAIIKLNPNAQVIVATHSPEIAGKFKKFIIAMEDILHA